MGKYLHWIFVSESETSIHAFSLWQFTCCKVRCMCNLVGYSWTSVQYSFQNRQQLQLSQNFIFIFYLTNFTFLFGHAISSQDHSLTVRKTPYPIIVPSVGTCSAQTASSRPSCAIQKNEQLLKQSKGEACPAPLKIETAFLWQYCGYMTLL